VDGDSFPGPNATTVDGNVRDEEPKEKSCADPKTRDPDSAYGRYGNEILAIERVGKGFTVLALDFEREAILASGTDFGLGEKEGETLRTAEEMVKKHLKKRNCVDVAKTRKLIVDGYEVNRNTFKVLEAGLTPASHIRQPHSPTAIFRYPEPHS
jgi:hypothetical protein